MSDANRGIDAALENDIPEKREEFALSVRARMVKKDVRERLADYFQSRA